MCRPEQRSPEPRKEPAAVIDTIQKDDNVLSYSCVDQFEVYTGIAVRTLVRLLYC